MNSLNVINKDTSICTIQLQKLSIENYLCHHSFALPHLILSYLHHQGNHYPIFCVYHYLATLYSFTTYICNSKNCHFQFFLFLDFYKWTCAVIYIPSTHLVWVHFGIHPCSWSLFTITHRLYSIVWIHHFFKKINLFIYLFIYGCIRSSLLRAGFL